jgi:hypothetical protein
MLEKLINLSDNTLELLKQIVLKREAKQVKVLEPQWFHSNLLIQEPLSLISLIAINKFLKMT